MKKVVLGILISLMILPTANAKIVAKVGDIEITDQEVAERMQQIPPQYQNAFASIPFTRHAIFYKIMY